MTIELPSLFSLGAGNSYFYWVAFSLGAGGGFVAQQYVDI